jgi:hypothetical protein
MLTWKEQTLAFDIHIHVVKVSLDVRQRNGLHELHGWVGLSVSGHSCGNAKSTENDEAAFHLSLPKLFFILAERRVTKRSRQVATT